MKIFSLQHKLNLSNSHKGKFSEKQKLAMENRTFGHRLIISCVICKKEFRVVLSRVKKGQVKYCSNICKGNAYLKMKKNPFTQEHRKNIGKVTKGRKNPYLYKLNKTKEHRQIVSDTMKNRVISSEERSRRSIINIQNGNIPPHKKGIEHYNWKGGITSINEQLRHKSEVWQWKKSVFKRDNYTCQLCKIKDGTLNANHIKKWSLFPELRTDLNNGITLCFECHKIVNRHEEEWELEFYFNLFNRGFLSNNLAPVNDYLVRLRKEFWL